MTPRTVDRPAAFGPCRGRFWTGRAIKGRISPVFCGVWSTSGDAVGIASVVGCSLDVPITFLQRSLFVPFRQNRYGKCSFLVAFKYPSSYYQRMESTDELANIEAMARTLVAQQLRSKAVLLERLLPLIDTANALGHTHAKIQETLQAAGVEMTLPVYMQTLKRARKRARERGVGGATGSIKPLQASGGSGELKSGSPDPKSSGSHEPTDSGSHDPNEGETPSSQVSDGSVFEVRNALKQAQKASQTDYRSIARQTRKPT